ncbi:hypothetical protein Nepgr_029880 [Nepenthes gracilis]|uniref:Uncharacterized protein n=1 Tax=Nepenthes gracilis TaxID=150966 RepID=A0AAD3TG53_NEPGR|nr:hypothetical protein Nepgr_029880 [Nepenthes gracilis]
MFFSLHFLLNVVVSRMIFDLGWNKNIFIASTSNVLVKREKLFENTGFLVYFFSFCIKVLFPTSFLNFHLLFNFQKAITIQSMSVQSFVNILFLLSRLKFGIEVWHQLEILT